MVRTDIPIADKDAASEVYWPPLKVMPEIERFLSQFVERADRAGAARSKLYVVLGGRVTRITVEPLSDAEQAAWKEGPR